jgi:hypothetical protein
VSPCPGEPTEDYALDQTEPCEALYELYKKTDEQSRVIETRIDTLVQQRDEVNISRDFLLALYRGADRIDQGYDMEAIRELSDAFDETLEENDPDCVAGSRVVEEEREGKRTVRAATPIARCVDKGLWNLFGLALKYTQQSLSETLSYLMSSMIRSWDHVIREQLQDEEAHLRYLWEMTQDESYFDAAVERAQRLPKSGELTPEESTSVMGDDYDLNGYMAVLSCVTVRESLAELDRIKERNGRSWREIVSDNLSELYTGKKRGEAL